MLKSCKALVVTATAALVCTAANAGYVTFDITAIGGGTLGGVSASSVTFQETFNFDFDIKPTTSSLFGIKSSTFSGAVTSASASSGYDGIESRLGSLDDAATSKVSFTASNIGIDSFSIGSSIPSTLKKSFDLSVSSLPIGLPYTTNSVTFLTNLFNSGATFAFTESGRSGPGTLAYVGTATVASFSPSNVTSPVPEPETYAMLLAGMGLITFVAMKRKGRGTVESAAMPA